MYEYLTAAILFYLFIKWCLGSFHIKRNYGDLYVVITGCDSGFGRDLAYKLDNCGFNVFATCLTKEGSTQLKKTTSERTQTVIVDVTETKDISNLVQILTRAIPSDKALWGVVNNAGIMLPQGPCAILNKDDYMKLLNVNLFGMIEINRQFIPLLRKSRGRIINTSSIVGRLSLGFAPYTVSKFAVEAYSDCLRRDLYHQGVSVHIIEPQQYLTPLMDAQNKEYVQRTYQKLLDRLPEEQRDYYGNEYAEKASEVYEKVVVQTSSKATYEVIDAYFHALTAKFPKTRYVVGFRANTVSRFFWSCPTWITDIVTCTVGTDSVKPAGEVK